MNAAAEAALSIRTAQSIAHHRLAELGDETHTGIPAECTRPLCRRLLQDADTVEALAREVSLR